MSALNTPCFAQAKSVFFANVSHELKTPMTLVVTPLENALRKVPKTAPEVILKRETFETVRHNAYRLSGLISDLLDLTKSEIGKARISPVEIPETREYFEKIFKSVAPLMEEKGLKFEFAVGPPPPPSKRVLKEPRPKPKNRQFATEDKRGRTTG